MIASKSNVLRVYLFIVALKIMATSSTKNFLKIMATSSTKNFF